jgi:hypothetical protein
MATMPTRSVMCAVAVTAALVGLLMLLMVWLLYGLRWGWFFSGSL